MRIAQELHDIVAHNVSLMVVKAQALGATVHDDRVSQSTDAIADLGRQAMTEMHTTLRLLRGDGETPELAPQPGLAQLERLVEQLRARRARDRAHGRRASRGALAQGVDLSAFRIIQEALTNVVKHAAGASTKVTLAYQAQGVRADDHRHRRSGARDAAAGALRRARRDRDARACRPVRRNADHRGPSRRLQGHGDAALRADGLVTQAPSRHRRRSADDAGGVQGRARGHRRHRGRGRGKQRRGGRPRRRTSTRPTWC